MNAIRMRLTGPLAQGFRTAFVVSVFVLLGCDTTVYAKNGNDASPEPSKQEAESEFESLDVILNDENEPTRLYRPTILVEFDQNGCPVDTRFRARVGAPNGPRIVLDTGLPISKAVMPRVKWRGVQRILPRPSQRPYWRTFTQPFAVYFSPLQDQLLVSDGQGQIGPEALLDADQLPVDINFKYSVVRIKYDGAKPIVYSPTDQGYCPPLDPIIRITY